MAIKVDELKRDTREGVGRVSEKEYDDDRIISSLNRAVLELSRYTPKLKKATLTTVSGQDIYEVTDLKNVDDTDFEDEVLVIFTDSWSQGHGHYRFGHGHGFLNSLGEVTHPLLGPGGDSEPLVSPASFATDLFLRRVEDELVRRDFTDSIEFRNDQIILMPTPDSAVKVYLLLGIAHEIEKVPSRFYEILLLKCKEIVAEDLIALRRGKYGSVKVGPSTVNLDVSALDKLRMEWSEEFKSKAQAIPPLTMP